MANILAGIDNTIPTARPGTAYTPKDRNLTWGCQYTLDTASSTLPWVDIRGFQYVTISIDATNAGAFSLDLIHGIDGVNQAGVLSGMQNIVAGGMYPFQGPLSFVRPRLNSIASGSLVVDIKVTALG